MKPMNKNDVWFKDLPPSEKESKIQEIGKKLFSTPDGAIWLATVLDDLRYNGTVRSEGEVALRNYATVLLRDRIGVVKDSMAVTTALLNIDQKE
jgi:hypothetical protein